MPESPLLLQLSGARQSVAISQWSPLVAPNVSRVTEADPALTGTYSSKPKSDLNMTAAAVLVAVAVVTFIVVVVIRRPQDG